jgi:hypothetical protein
MASSRKNSLFWLRLTQYTVKLCASVNKIPVHVEKRSQSKQTNKQDEERARIKLAHFTFHQALPQQLKAGCDVTHKPGLS